MSLWKVKNLFTTYFYFFLFFLCYYFSIYITMAGLRYLLKVDLKNFMVINSYPFHKALDIYTNHLHEL